MVHAPAVARDWDRIAVADGVDAYTERARDLDAGQDPQQGRDLRALLDALELTGSRRRRRRGPALAGRERAGLGPLEMRCHLGFWDSPAEFNGGLAAFLDTA